MRKRLKFTVEFDVTIGAGEKIGLPDGSVVAYNSIPNEQIIEVEKENFEEDPEGILSIAEDLEVTIVVEDVNDSPSDS